LVGVILGQKCHTGQERTITLTDGGHSCEINMLKSIT